MSNMVKHVSKPLRCNEIQGFCDTAERRLAETEAVSCGGGFSTFCLKVLSSLEK